MLKEIKIKNVNKLNVMAKFGSNEPLLDMEVSLCNLDEPSEYHKLTTSNNVKIVYEVEDEILDKEEKKYLGNLIRPFRESVTGITKEVDFEGAAWISIEIDEGDDCIDLPMFYTSDMYVGMEDDKKYTIEELGL